MKKIKWPDKSFYQTRPMQIASIIFPFVAFGIFYLCRGFLAWIGKHLWGCPFYASTGLYCTGCGNTRSVMALLRGDILSSLRFNICPMLVVTVTIMFYIEYLTFSFKHPIKIVPRKWSFWAPFMIFMAVYFVVRNFIPYLTP